MTHEALTTFEALQRQQGRVRALARSLVRDAAAADDLVQEALLAAWRRPTPATGEARGFAARVLRNLARDRARGEGRRARRESEVARKEAMSDVADAVVAAERQRALVDAVLALDEPYRGAVLLRWFEDLPPRVIARRTGRSVEAVKKQLQRGLEQLRARLEERFGRDGAWAVALLPLTADSVLRGGTAAVTASTLRRAVLGAALLGGAVFGVNALWPTQRETHDAALVAEFAESRSGVEERVEHDPAAEPTSPDLTRVAVGGAEQLHDAVHAASRAGVALDMQRPVTFDPPFRARLVDLHGVMLARELLRELELVYAHRGVQVEALRSANTGPTMRLRPDADGWVESALVPPSGTGDLGELEVARGPWVVLAIGARSGAPAERFVVIAPAVRVAGVVQDAGGAPAAAVRADVRADVRALGTFPFDLVTDGERRWAAASDAAGRFELDRVPTHTRFAITFEAGARGSTAIPTPEHDATGVVVRLALPRPRATLSLHGRVIDDAGAAIESARVELAWLRALSDARGEFRFELDAEQLSAIAESHGKLTVIAADGRFAHVALEPDDLGPYVLRLPDAMHRIAGRLVDASGSPLAGVRVVLYDGTRTSSTTTREGSDGARTPGRGVTNEEGRFALEQLLERPYTLRFLRTDPFLVLDAPDVAAGTHDLVVRVPDEHLLQRLTGRAVDVTGRPLPGIRVTPMAYENAPGGNRALLYGPSVRTDDLGRFEVTGMPRLAVSLDFDTRPDDFMSGFIVPIEALAAPHAGDVFHAGDIIVELDCDVVARLAEGYIGGKVRFVDAAGVALRVSQVEPFGLSFTMLVDQKGDGTLGRLYVPQRAVAAEVLDADGRTLRRVPLALSPLEPSALEL